MYFIPTPAKNFTMAEAKSHRNSLDARGLPKTLPGQLPRGLDSRLLARVLQVTKGALKGSLGGKIYPPEAVAAEGKMLLDQLSIEETNEKVHCIFTDIRVLAGVRRQ
jgi:hypothetical protein